MNSSSLGGRPRRLDFEKKDALCQLVAYGYTVDEAAGSLGVSPRTVRRELLRDQQFNRELLAAQRQPPNPAKIMQSAARTHWRAAAWLLERTDPERFGRRPPNSASPEQVQKALTIVVEAALEAAPPEERRAVYQHLQAAATRAFSGVFPNYAAK